MLLAFVGLNSFLVETGRSLFIPVNLLGCPTVDWYVFTDNLCVVDKGSPRHPLLRVFFFFFLLLLKFGVGQKAEKALSTLTRLVTHEREILLATDHGKKSFNNISMSCFSLAECDGFLPLNHLSGGTKDSQITASSSRIKDFLPYSATSEDDLSGWTPLRSSGEELHTVHFIQVDLRYAIQTKFVVSIVCQSTLRLLKLGSKSCPVVPHLEQPHERST